MAQDEQLPEPLSGEKTEHGQPETLEPVDTPLSEKALLAEISAMTADTRDQAADVGARPKQTIGAYEALLHPEMGHIAEKAKELCIDFEIFKTHFEGEVELSGLITALASFVDTIMYMILKERDPTNPGTTTIFSSRHSRLYKSARRTIRAYMAKHDEVVPAADDTPLDLAVSYPKKRDKYLNELDAFSDALLKLISRPQLRQE